MFRLIKAKQKKESVELESSPFKGKDADCNSSLSIYWLFLPPLKAICACYCYS